MRIQVMMDKLLDKFESKQLIFSNNCIPFILYQMVNCSISANNSRPETAA